MRLILKRLLQQAVMAAPESVRNYVAPIINSIAVSNQSRRLKNAVESAAFMIDNIRDPEAPAVFIDCGFNNGLVMQSFIDNLSRDFDYYGFEVQEDLRPDAIDLLNRNDGRQITLNFMAVSDSDEDVTYYPSRQTPWGLFPRIATTTQLNRHVGPHMDYTSERTIAGLDFSEWLAKLHDYYLQSSGKPPFVVVKMNIEGAEYPVLQKVLQDGNLGKISFLMAEFHVAQFQEPQRSRFEAAQIEIDEYLKACDIPVMEWK